MVKISMTKSGNIISLLIDVCNQRYNDNQLGRWVTQKGNHENENKHQK